MYYKNCTRKILQMPPFRVGQVLVNTCVLRTSDPIIDPQHQQLILAGQKALAIQTSPYCSMGRMRTILVIKRTNKTHKKLYQWINYQVSCRNKNCFTMIRIK